MAGQYENPISVKEAIDKINSRDILLPAIQRKFVWSSLQICALFDSLFQGYPINTFMFWAVNDAEIKNQYKFYEVLKEYCHRFKEENPAVATNAAFKDFSAVIDGQQRLTSFYIGLCGTYAYKQPRVWWPSHNDSKVLPPRKLYIDLLQRLPGGDEAQFYYNLRFLTDEQYIQSLSDTEDNKHWYCLHDVLKLKQYDSVVDVLREIVNPELKSRELDKNEFAQTTLLKVYQTIRHDRTIHYFKETSQKLDYVLDVFIRTNSGGTQLSFSDLLMSIAVANWNGDFRKEVEDLTTRVYQSSKMGFYIERDWILKTSLMLTEADIAFKVRNFDAEQVSKIQAAWSEIQECITETLIFIHSCGINAQSLTSKNAVIPICYYLYKKQTGTCKLYKIINNPAKNYAERTAISKWLYMVLLRGVFGAQADSVLNGMRNVIKENLTKQSFPLQAIVDRYAGTNKDLRFDDEFLERLLNIQHGDVRCRPILHLLYPDKSATESLHIDHMHPQDSFKLASLKKQAFLKNNEELFNFYATYWNSIPNLQLLNEALNLSKQDSSLEKWLQRPNFTIKPQDLFVEDDEVAFEKFQIFYTKRLAKLKEILKANVFMTVATPIGQIATIDDDEEEAEESYA